MSQLLKDRYPEDVLAYCAQRDLTDKLDLVVNLVNQAFPEAQRVIVGMEEDPESDDRCIMVDAVVAGSAFDIGPRHQDCARRIGRLLRWPVNTQIRTIYTLV